MLPYVTLGQCGVFNWSKHDLCGSCWAILWKKSGTEKALPHAMKSLYVWEWQRQQFTNELGHLLRDLQLQSVYSKIRNSILLFILATVQSSKILMIVAFILHLFSLSSSLTVLNEIFEGSQKEKKLEVVVVKASFCEGLHSSDVAAKLKYSWHCFCTVVASHFKFEFASWMQMQRPTTEKNMPRFTMRKWCRHQ